MRGKGIASDVPAVSAGITPAYAGKSSAYLPYSRGCTDHPRLCGEKDADLSGGGVGEGITPAYAGKRCVSQIRNFDMWDHPRLCGEKSPFYGKPMKLMGSPPPMRGKGCLNRVEECCKRITPAYAGKSSTYPRIFTCR